MLMNKLSVANNHLVFISQKVRHQILYSLGRLVAVEQLAKQEKPNVETGVQQKDVMKAKKIPATT